jgi:hypothetical protein
MMHRLRHSLALSYLAVVALALQLSVSFGHIHHDLKLHPHASWPVAVCHPTPDQACKSPQHDEQHDPCAICFALAMMETAVASAPPAVVIELDVVDSQLPAVAFASRHLQTACMFQARAPPPTV